MKSLAERSLLLFHVISIPRQATDELRNIKKVNPAKLYIQNQIIKFGCTFRAHIPICQLFMKLIRPCHMIREITEPVKGHIVEKKCQKHQAGGNLSFVPSGETSKATS